MRASADTVDVVSRNRVIATAPRDSVGAGECSVLSIVAAPTFVEADFQGIDDPSASGLVEAGDLRPMVTGIYTDLDVDTAVPAELDVVVDVDSRFTTEPSALKWAAMVLGPVHSRRPGPCGSTRPTAGAACASARNWFRIRPGRRRDRTLGVWHIIGGNTSDDGYILSMARAAEPAGYMANYYRWYGVPESPFGRRTDLLTLFSQVSTASPWMRLPARSPPSCVGS